MPMKPSTAGPLSADDVLRASARAAEAWFYRNTEAGRTLREVFHHLRGFSRSKPSAHD
jgi:hypothetical protein